MERLVLIGDSLTEWGNWEDLLRGYRVLNLGVSGETTRGLYARRDLIRSALCDRDCIFVMSGINDILMGDEDVVTFIKVFTRFLLETPLDLKITLQGLLPVCGDFIDYLNTVRVNNEAIAELAKALGVGFLDLYSRFVDPQGIPIRGYFDNDGVHLSLDGYRVWGSAILGQLADFHGR